MTSSPTVAAAAALTFAAGLTLSGSTAAIAQTSLGASSPITPSLEIANAPSAPLAPSVRQQALAATPIPKIELWHGATLGMTLDQVKALFPKGYGPGPVGKAKEAPVEDDGTIALWQMDEQVYGRDGVATLFFSNGGLASVLIDMKDIEPAATADNMADAKVLETGFSGYYGKPKLCLNATARGLNQVDCRWEGHGLRIGLSYQDFGGLSPRMAIAIRPLPPPLKARQPFFGKRIRKGSSTS